MWTKLSAAALMLGLAFATPASADTFKDAMAALQRGDFARALPALFSLSEAGHPGAQREIGTMYLMGLGVEQDTARGLDLLRAAAKSGDGGAMSTLGFASSMGLGVQKDLAMAVRWYRAAAAKDDANAFHNLAGMHYRGEGVPKSLINAYMWIELAVQKGVVGAARDRDAMREELTPAMLEEAVSLAREWKPAP